MWQGKCNPHGQSPSTARRTQLAEPNWLLAQQI
jgi:hypothetical protein